MDLLVPVTVYELNSTGHLSYSWRLYYNATIPYFGHQHLPYAILATGMLFLFVLFPVLLLTLYPFRWFQKLLNLFPIRWYVLYTLLWTRSKAAIKMEHNQELVTIDGMLLHFLLCATF